MLLYSSFTPKFKKNPALLFRFHRIKMLKYTALSFTFAFYTLFSLDYAEIFL